MALCVVTTSLAIFAFVLIANVRSAPSGQEVNAISFMQKFGYIEEDAGGPQALLDPKSAQKFVDAVKLMQSFGGIPETGEIDQETIKLMSSKRCGVKDVLPDSEGFESVDEEETSTGVTGFQHDHHFHNQHQHHHHHHHHHNHSHQHEPNHSRKKRYIVASRLWRKRQLKYYLANTTSKLSRDEVMRTFEEALNTWGRHGRLDFTPASDHESADITFSFFSGYHGDPYPFDGIGQVLAHAYFPGTSNYEGDIHFDDDENWKINLGKYDAGVDLFTVALHELGHSLGLSHSRNEDSIMNPYYRGSGRDLGYDDRRAMYELYATKRLRDEAETESRYPVYRPPYRPRRPTTKTTTLAPTTEKLPERTTHRNKAVQNNWNGPSQKRGCYGDFDTVALVRRELFITKGLSLWRLQGPGRVQAQYPADFHRLFSGLPDDVKRLDAIYERDHDSAIVFFAGRQYWVYDGRVFIEGSPRPIQDYGLPGYVDKIDAATSSNNTVLLFSGDLYWTYDDLNKTPGRGSPRSVPEVWGLPPHIDAALTYTDGVTYFFKGDRFWEYDESRGKLKQHRETASDFWLNC